VIAESKISVWGPFGLSVIALNRTSILAFNTIERAG